MKRSGHRRLPSPWQPHCVAEALEEAHVPQDASAFAAGSTPPGAHLRTQLPGSQWHWDCPPRPHAWPALSSLDRYSPSHHVHVRGAVLPPFPSMTPGCACPTPAGQGPHPPAHRSGVEWSSGTGVAGALRPSPCSRNGHTMGSGFLP